VQGGVLSYIADNALTFAGGSVLGDVVTAEFKINYLCPAKDAQTLLAVAAVVGSSQSQAVCRSDVFAVNGDDKTLCAAAQGTIRKVG
jgi:acyl-coenzyme A thioesterase PaaI-like protein